MLTIFHSPSAVSLLCLSAAHELKRDWRRLGSDPHAEDVRYRYLRALDAAKLPGMMKGGAGLEVLGEMLDVLSHHCASATSADDDSSDADAMFDLLLHLSLVQRFTISVACLSAQQKQSASRVLEWLRVHLPAAADGREAEGRAEGMETKRSSSWAALLSVDEARVDELARRYKIPRA